MTDRRAAAWKPAEARNIWQSSALRRASLLAGMVVLGTGALRANVPDAERVVLLANSNDPGSLRIARHYAVARGVPPANIIALDLPLAEVITWPEFVASLWRPLMDRLVQDRWIDAIPMSLTDAAGRRKYAVHHHSILALIVCRGVPLKIGHEAAFAADALPFTTRGELRTNAGAVDSELSLLAAPNYNINAFVPNPHFQSEASNDTDRGTIVKTARLDGPSVDDALGLVDRAINAEKSGLWGRAYVDFSDRDPMGNEWLRAVGRQLQDLGFETQTDHDGAAIPATARFDAPALYFGWYAADVEGPFVLPGFRFPPGAIALHIHSYSAATLRSATAGWSGPLVARGVTATIGNVYEPYLQFTHRPDLLLRSLARGHRLVDAAYYALPMLSWQGILIGDPLYRPFATTLEQQIDAMAELPARLSAYVTLRRMKQLEALGRNREAIALAIQHQHAKPALPVGIALARLLRESGELGAAADALEFAAALKSLAADEWALAAEAAAALTTYGGAQAALRLWQTLFAERDLPSKLRLSWLPEAQRTATAAKATALAEQWRVQFAELSATSAGR